MPTESRFPRAALLGLLLAVGAGCSPSAPRTFQGYVEADDVHVAAPLAGTLVERPVRRGGKVAVGAPLFVLERGAERAAVAEAEGRLSQSRSRLENLRKGGRPSEIAAIEGRLAQARATLILAESELARHERLYRDQVIAGAELDQARSRRDANEAQVSSLAADLETARLGGREDEIRAARDDVAAAEATLARARWAYDQKAVAAPVEGEVHDTHYEVGEFVTAGSPVVTLLPPSGRKIRFYVPQARLSEVVPGAEVEGLVDGVAAPVRAVVRYVSTRPEFTPPVIYSREARQKLVFLVEAEPAPADAPGLHPGQPLDVRPVSVVR